MEDKVLKAGELITAFQGKPLWEIDSDAPLNGISTDSRMLQRGDVFFALKGERFNGHDFVEEALAHGARHVVVQELRSSFPTHRSKANFILVKDTLKAYGDLAAYTRRKFKIPVVAVTGSSGKTTVKELVAHFLSSRFSVLKNRGTENNLVGVPKTIFGLEKQHEALVLEMGTNRPGEIERLSAIAGPNIAVLTQIGAAHLEGLKSIEGVFKEKLSVLKSLERGGFLVLNGEDPLLSEFQSGTHSLCRVGFSKSRDTLAAEPLPGDEQGSSFSLNGEFFHTSLLGRHNVLNILMAMAAARHLGVSMDSLKESLRTFKAVSGRLTMKEWNDIRFIDDTYNSNPNSFGASLETLNNFKIHGRKGVVCGDMLELGDSSEQWHRELGAALAKFSFDFVIAAGPWSRTLVEEAISQGFHSERIHHVSDSAEAGRLCLKIAKPGDCILVKGSRSTQMEKVFECFMACSTL